jgi:hypothetical protein
MANITNKFLLDWANEHDAEFAAMVDSLALWRMLYRIAVMYDLETVDDEGISHGTARDDLPYNSFYVVHKLVDDVITKKVI